MSTNITLDLISSGLQTPTTVAAKNDNPITPPPLNLIAVFLAVAALLPFLLYLHHEYLAFLALGPGGTPSTFGGFLRVKALGLFALRDVYTPRAGSKRGKMAAELTEGVEDSVMSARYPSWSPPITMERAGSTNIYVARRSQRHKDSRKAEQLQKPARRLPPRRGPRPETRGIAPHRQVTQRGPLEAFTQTATALRDMAERYAGVLAVGTSCFEPHTVGLFVLRSAGDGDEDGEDASTEDHDGTRTHPSKPQTDPRRDAGTTISSRSGTRTDNARASKSKHCGAEIAHVHPSDGSLHVVLPLGDVDAVLASAWGERHPLARGGWWERFVPEGFLMVYAPRDEREVGVVMDIVETAVEGFLGGGGGRGKKR